jgi:hypothetical protein
MSNHDGLTKRAFLQTLGAAAPSLKLMLGQAPASPPEDSSPKFTTVDCSSFRTASAADVARLAGPVPHFMGTLSGRQSFRGIPFRLTSLVLSRQTGAGSTDSVQVPVDREFGFACLAQFCARDKNETPAPGVLAIEKVGQPLADVVMLFDDGSEHRHPIRRRFEVNAPSVIWGHLCFAAVPHRQDVPSKLTDPLTNARHWGDLQIGVWNSNYEGDILWICAIANPHPERKVQALRLEARDEDPLVVCGLTLYHGRENPLRYDRLSLYRITLPAATDIAASPARWDVRVDLGVVARVFQLPVFEPEAWLASPAAGLGESRGLGRGAGFLYAEVSASPEATLTLRDAETGPRYEFDLGKASPGGEPEARIPGARVEVLEREKVWLQGRIVDAATDQPAAVRLAFRSKEGRYLPPYGHRTEISTGWFQDYGADLQIEDDSFAYVDGAFQIELPVGDVYVEATKGFEYEPIRSRLRIEPGQRELSLKISRFADLRAQGWVSADSHVHFLSPSTSILEGQAEGLNLINLLAAQWGDLFTNVGDLSQGPLRSKDGQLLVAMGTENRNHILGHLGLLGGHGAPVYPMSAAGPGESYIGDPLWTSLSEWADACRQREGLAVAVHFPYPTGELAADIVLGKIDAVEIRPEAPSEHFNSLRFLDWYHYLNCGYRLPVCGGTDKMSAFVPVGSQRGYAYLGQDEFTFANWAKAVRKGNTFMSSGPLLLFHADGHAPGEEIALRSGGGTIEVRAHARTWAPIHRLEVVWNGAVVASREESRGAREMTLAERVRVPGPGWLAARCVSRQQVRDGRIAAHTSAVYVTVPGAEPFSAPAAAYMLTLIEGTETWARDFATRPDAERFERVVKVLAAARAELHRRMHQQGIRH